MKVVKGESASLQQEVHDLEKSFGANEKEIRDPQAAMVFREMRLISTRGV